MYGLGYSENCVFEHSLATLKKYNENCYKVTLIKACRLPGFEERDGFKKTKRGAAGNTKSWKQAFPEPKAE